MRKTFKVAGHRFVVEMPDRYPLWDLMEQYAPFEVQEAGEDAIFTLEWVPSLPEAEKTPFFVEVPEDEGQSRIEFTLELVRIIVQHLSTLCTSKTEFHHQLTTVTDTQ